MLGVLVQGAWHVARTCQNASIVPLLLLLVESVQRARAVSAKPQLRVGIRMCSCQWCELLRDASGANAESGQSGPESWTLSVALAVRVHEICSSRCSPSQSPNSSQSQSPCAGSTASGSLPSSGIKFDSESQAPSPGLSSHPRMVKPKGVRKSVRELKSGSTSYSWKRCNRDLSTY